ncbi:MAG: outer membrane beta-barrel protein [Tunicatimonas sp.]|uniref:outer membrane beta-barrel protein n=1 Tax=Tunicatimonas sp. TaxID=1940096 RepID=UPI003C732376
MIACSQAQAQILTGPIVGGQATIAGYGSQYDGIDFQQDLSLNYLGGWSYAYSVSDHLAFYSELVYSRKGKVQRYNSTSTRIVENQTYSHFLEAPILLRITSPIGRSKVRWFINAGPQISYWLGGRGTMLASEFFGSDQLTQIDYTVSFSEDEPTDGVLAVEDANRIQFGLAAGGGFIIPVNRLGHALMINIRYVSGTTFMGGNESSEIGTSEIEEYLGYKHNALLISAAYVVPINIFGMRKGKTSRKVNHKK